MTKLLYILELQLKIIMSARADKSVPVLSDVDRKILKILLVPDGNIQSNTIATKLGIPLSYN